MVRNRDLLGAIWCRKRVGQEWWGCKKDEWTYTYLMHLPKTTIDIYFTHNLYRRSYRWILHEAFFQFV